MKKMYSEEEIKAVAQLYRHNITFTTPQFTYGVHGSVISSYNKPFADVQEIYHYCKDVTIPVVCYTESGDTPTINAVSVEADGVLRVNSVGVPPVPLNVTSVSDHVFPV